jgi:ApaG protein
MFSATTQGITVRVTHEYRIDESIPVYNRYVFSYRIRIENMSEETVQLLHRHWQITNGIGEERDVAGEGVVGQQPVIEPGYAFEYTSFCVLATPLGSMHGTYEMLRMSDQKQFFVIIPEFHLEALTLQN